MRELSKSKASTEILMMAAILDQLRWLSWTKTKAAQKNQGKPKSILAAILESGKEKKEELVNFSSGGDFEQYRSELLGR